MANSKIKSIIRYSKEDFGYLVVFPDGSINLYSQDAEGLLVKNPSKLELEKYRLHQINIKNNFHLKSPLIVWFEVTKRCDLSCSHCYINAGKARNSELSLEEIKDFLDDLKNLGTFSLVLAGGEPYLRPDFPEILSYASDLGFVIAIVSNGTFLTEETLKNFPQENCRITLSVDGTTSHNIIRGGKSTFEFMKKKLSLLKSFEIPCSISTVISKANIHELEDLLNWCMSEDIVFRTVTFNPLGRGLLNRDIHQLKIEDAELSSKLFMMQKRYEGEKDKDIGMCVSKFFNYALNLMYMTRREHCSRSIAYVSSNGNVYPCVSSAAIDQFRAGNIRNTGFSYIWEHSFKDMRSITWDQFKVCHSCEFNSKDYFCANRCPCMSLVLHGELFNCGATDFEKEDLRLRTEKLKKEMNYVY